MSKILILISGIYLLVLGLLSAAGAVLLILSPIFLSSQPQMEGPNALFVTLMYASLAGWLVTTAVGIFMYKSWALTSVYVMSLLTLVFGFSILSILFFFPAPSASMPNLTAIKIVMAFFFLLVPALFLALYGSKNAKELFHLPSGLPLPEKPSAPLGVKIIGYFYILTVLSLVWYLLHPATIGDLKFNLGNLVIAGASAFAYTVIYTLIQFLIGVGLLQRKMSAWKGCLILNGLCIIIGIYNALVTKKETIDLIFQGQEAMASTISEYYGLFILISLVSPVCVIFYMLFRKQSFIQ